MEAAIAAGKHVYCEKPLAVDSAEALRLARLAKAAGVKHGVVQDKLFLPGMRKLKRLIDSGFFGRILSVRGEFGYWVFEGDWQPAQRPSWNYRKQDGGGIIVDMFCHWRYVLDHTFGRVRAVQCLGGTTIPERVDEKEDATSARQTTRPTGRLNSTAASLRRSIRRGRFASTAMNSSACRWMERWAARLPGLRECRTQHRVNTPRPVWNPGHRESVPVSRTLAWTCRTIRSSTTGSKFSGNSFCGTLQKMRRFLMTFWKGLVASS